VSFPYLAPVLSRLPIIEASPAPSASGPTLAEPAFAGANYVGPERQSRRIYIETFGCQMNQHDSDRIIGLMAAEGYAQTEKPDDADLIVVNSCSVRDKAEQKLRTAAGQMKKFKRKRPDTIIALGGCVAQQEGQNLLERVQHVDLVFGPDHLFRLPDLITKIRNDRVRLNETVFLGRSEYVFPDIKEEAPIQPSAFVNVMKGCDKYCSFCVVPMTRGPEVSRPAADIVREVRMLAEKGTKEVVLLGQTVNSYGRIKQQGQIPFAQLLAQVCGVDGIQRVRFTSPHPAEFSPDQIQAFADLDELCPHMHLPVQSGSSRVLNMMRRGYSRETFIDICHRFKKAVPHAGLTTDIIVGFPGETEADFEETLSLMRQVRFHSAFSFAYSERKGTKALELGDSVAPEERLRRLHVLQALQEEHSQEWLAQMVGRSETLMIEGPSKSDPTRSSGRSGNNRMVHVDGLYPPGTFVEVEIIEAFKHSLLAKVKE
jgi:tRNA-2-methylthio-N6-dimethylallyladenosine synthase